MTWRDTGITWGAPGWTWTGQPAPRTWSPKQLVDRSGHDVHGPRTIAFPMRLDAAGRVVTVAVGSARHAAETAGHILSTQPGERGLAPGWGMHDPSGQAAVTPDTVIATLTACQPDLTVADVRVEARADGQVGIRLDARWAAHVEV